MKWQCHLSVYAAEVDKMYVLLKWMRLSKWTGTAFRKNTSEAGQQKTFLVCLEYHVWPGLLFLFVVF